VKRGRLSLLIPVFNHEKYLPELFESVERQTRQPEEILFSDDGSRDGSAGLVQAWIGGRAGGRLFRQEKNLGITENSNFLLRQAQGEYVLTLHSDDSLREADALAEMTGALDRDSRLAMVTCQRARISETDELLCLERKLEPRRYGRKEILRVVLTTEANPVGEPSAVMFRHEALPDGFDPAYRQLWDLKGWLEILQSGEAEVLERPLVNIREHASQATRANEMAGRGVEEHLRLFADLLSEADSVLGQRAKSVLLYKLGQTSRRFPSLASREIRLRLLEVKKDLGIWKYFGDLLRYRMEKITTFARRKFGMADIP
jgi:glycosyltransferase involved in cell wall biosynthesis